MGRDVLIVPILGDITNESVDAIVNAANPSLLGGGGVDGPSMLRPGLGCWRSAGGSAAVGWATPW